MSELVTNSVRHAELSDGDTLLVRVRLAVDTVRLEIENSGTAGAVATRQPDSFGLSLVALLAPRWRVGEGLWGDRGRHRPAKPTTKPSRA